MKTDVVAKDGCVVIPRVETAQGFVARMKGLLGRDSLPNGHAMFFRNCSVVHTFGMRFRLDLLFLDRDGVIVRFVSGVCPSRIVWGGPKAASLLEAEAGWMGRCGLDVGDRLVFGDEERAGHTS